MRQLVPTGCAGAGSGVGSIAHRIFSVSDEAVQIDRRLEGMYSNTTGMAARHTDPILDPFQEIPLVAESFPAAGD